MKSKIFSIVLILNIAVLATALAATALSYGDFEYIIKGDDTICIIGYTGKDSNVKIPSTIDNFQVSEIGDKVFCNRPDIVSVSLPDSIASIGNESFYSCNELMEIYIPNSVNSIGIEAFGECDRLIASFDPDSYAHMYFMANDLQYQYLYTEDNTLVISNTEKSIYGETPYIISYDSVENTANIPQEEEVLMDAGEFQLETYPPVIVNPESTLIPTKAPNAQSTVSPKSKATLSPVPSPTVSPAVSVKP